MKSGGDDTARRFSVGHLISISSHFCASSRVQLASSGALGLKPWRIPQYYIMRNAH